MKIRTLEYCATVARLGNFSRAAEALHVAQPALSIAIKKLEEELGVTLFVRQARSVSPTPEGAMLLKRAERIFQELDSARREIDDAVELRSGEVKVGLPPIHGMSYFPQLMVAFHSSYPGVTLTMVQGSADETTTRLDKGVIDLALLESRRVRPGWRQVQVGEEEMVLCVRPDHPLAQRDRVSGRDLDGLDMAVFDGNFIQRQLLDKICERAGAKFQRVVQSNYVPLIRHAAVDGLGAATLLRSLVESEPGLVALSFDPPEILQFSLCWYSDRYLSRANQAFVGFALRRYESGG